MTKVTRRDFIKIGAAGTAATVLAGCGSGAERYVKLEPYVVPPEQQLPGIATRYATVCRMCPAGCGLIAEVANGRAIKVDGNPLHPVSRGKTCARGQSGPQLLYNPDRIPGAVRQEERGSRKFTPIAWNEAINTLHDRISGANGAVAIWLGSTLSGHVYDIFALFADAIGAPAPLQYDLYTGVNGYHVLADASQQLFDRATLPSYDLGQADVIFSFGADFAGTWTSATGFNVEYGAFRDQPYGQRGVFVQFEPRMSNTAAEADRWVPIRPGAEALVAQALIRIIADEGYGNADVVDRAQSLAGDVDVAAAAEACGLETDGLSQLAALFAGGLHAVALPGSALTGRSDALAAVMAVQALNVVAGTVGLPGGLYVAPDLPVENLTPPPVSTYADVSDLVARMQAGDVSVLLVHGANPVYEMPPSLGLVEALANVETVISFNAIVDETSALADYILPDRVFLESWGYDIPQPTFQGMPVVGSQQPVVEPLYDVRSTPDVILTVAKGIPAAAAALPWQDEVAYIREKITQLPGAPIGAEDNDVFWARFQQLGGWWPDTQPELNRQPNMMTPASVAEPQYQGNEGEYPLYLQLYLSVLLSDGRGASIPWLQGTPDPMTTATWGTWVEMNPTTAKELGVGTGDIVEVTSPFGTIRAPIYEFRAIRPDTVAIPFGQGHDDYGRYARNRGANPIQLVGADPAAGDAGNLNWSTVRVKITKTGESMTVARLESTIEPEADVHVPF